MWYAPVFVMFSNRILAISRVNWRMYPENQENNYIGVHIKNRDKKERFNNKLHLPTYS